MNSGFIAAIIIGIIFFALKFIQMRVSKTQERNVKKIFNESLFVAISAFLGNLIISQFSVIVENIEKVPTVFTNDPDF